ncbi:uncharacterized protein LOC116300413 [Actinia tenebrosa]|uniref:Uncharacterized protein LOC116300413 n=1 Tax=Actinia tenebrosa TaxID=6105 RepID=A0A6P8I9A5_ACTTE|nr:uncharacterized protein LOC116300413 [Actinia tenebrosa]
MTSSPSKSGYKWWEGDDKTKRLYTELLAEKIARSPKKTLKTNSTLTRSVSSCSDLRSRIQALEHQGSSPPSSPIKRSASIRSLSSLEESDSSHNGTGKKYTFETVTIDTLAKHEYIKSPKKKPFGSKESSSSSSSSSSPSPPTSGSDEEYEKKRFSMRKTYDMKEKVPRATSGFHGDQKNGFQGDEKKNPWAWSSKESTVTGNNPDRWSLSFSDKGKGPATPTKSCFSPKTSPRLSSIDSDLWMKPNPMFMLMTSSQKPELKSFGCPDNSKAIATTSTQSDVTKERFLKSKSKLDEVPEYKSSSSEYDVADGASSDGGSGDRAKNSSITFKTQGFNSQKYNFQSSSSNDEDSGRNDKETGFMKSVKKREIQAGDDSKKVQENARVKFNHVDEVEGQIDINQITKKFQALCEEVEQLEFKMFEFSDDIRKLKIGIGLKDDSTNSENQVSEIKHHYKHAFTLAAGKDLLSERATARALLMKQYSSPSKSPRSISKLLQDTGIDKEMAEADARRSQVLEEELRKINEKDLTEDEIQEVLRSAKAKYIDRSNYLEDIGFSIKKDRKKG